MKGLEDAFKVPVIESYGMTEAGHQMSGNPMPPLERKPGKVFTKRFSFEVMELPVYSMVWS